MNASDYANALMAPRRAVPYSAWNVKTYGRYANGNGTKGKTTMNGGNGGCCENPIASRLEPCGYLRSPCRVWYAASKVATAAAASGSTILKPQQPFAGDLLQLFAEDVAAGGQTTIDVTSIKVGSRDQTVQSSSGILASVFLNPLAYLNPLNLDPADAGTEITISWTNPSAGAVQVYTALFGRTIR
jgi:hypothetical protein